MDLLIQAFLRLFPTLEERQSIARKAVHIVDPEKTQLEVANMVQEKTVFALPGCRPISVNTLLCVMLWGWLKDFPRGKRQKG